MFNDLNLKEEAEVTPREVLTLLFALALCVNARAGFPRELIKNATECADAFLEQPK